MARLTLEEVIETGLVRPDRGALYVLTRSGAG